jgi:hypothetical protein
MDITYNSELKRRSKLVAAARRTAFVATATLLSILALDDKYKSATLLFGVLVCAALFYEQGFKFDAKRKSLLSFIAFYLCPMLVVACLVCRRVLGL